ncbi:hypothetical protein THS27_05275 [Thalassospira sp. MCCC 1A01428]|nr:hypothetical protein THS27_05275 [Thalassospira sp. MCCC 1A01428]
MISSFKNAKRPKSRHHPAFEASIAAIFDHISDIFGCRTAFYDGDSSQICLKSHRQINIQQR